MTYFHPRDFDPNQPSIPGLSMMRRFRSYVGLGRSLAKFEKMLSAADWDDPRRIMGSTLKPVDNKGAQYDYCESLNRGTIDDYVDLFREVYPDSEKLSSEYIE